VEVTSSAVRDAVASALIGWYKESARSLTRNTILPNWGSRPNLWETQIVLDWRRSGSLQCQPQPVLALVVISDEAE